MRREACGTERLASSTRCKCHLCAQTQQCLSSSHFLQFNSLQLQSGMELGEQKGIKRCCAKAGIPSFWFSSNWKSVFSSVVTKTIFSWKHTVKATCNCYTRPSQIYLNRVIQKQVFQLTLNSPKQQYNV